MSEMIATETTSSSLLQPVGKINLREFDNIQTAIQRINVGGGGSRYPVGALPKAHAASVEDHHYAPLIPQQKKLIPRVKDKGECVELRNSSSREYNHHVHICRKCVIVSSAQ